MAGGTVKPFSQARLWGQKHAKTHRFLKILPQTSSNHLNDQRPLCVLSRLHFCAELRIDFLGACKPRGLIDGGSWRIMDHGGPNCSLSNPDKALAMYKEIWTERRTLIFYLYKPSESVWYLSLVHNLPVSLLSFLTILCKVKMQKCHYCILRIAKGISSRWNQRTCHKLISLSKLSIQWK